MLDKLIGSTQDLIVTVTQRWHVYVFIYLVRTRYFSKHQHTKRKYTRTRTYCK